VPNTLLEQANQAAIDTVKQQAPSQFTVGGARRSDGTIVGGVTVDRKWSNGWGLTAYARAYWNDQPVETHRAKVQGEAGFEVTKKF
jgi:hypothetical protein